MPFSKKPTVAEIQEKTAAFYGIDRADILGKLRNKTVSNARRIAIYLSYQIHDLSFASLGEDFNRDHASVQYTIESIKEKIERDDQLKDDIESILESLSVEVG